MAAGPAGGGAASGTGWRGLVAPLLLPSWLVIGIFLLLPVMLMAVYSFLTKDFRGGIIWQFSLEAYDQFFLDRGLFGDEPASINWNYIAIFWRSIWQAGLATLLCLAIGFPTAWFIATRNPRHRALWVFLITVPYWVNLLIRTVSMRFLLRDQGPFNEALLGRPGKRLHSSGFSTVSIVCVKSFASKAIGRPMFLWLPKTTIQTKTSSTWLSMR
jgi:spermidine/putrescine transport system permease protein